MIKIKRKVINKYYSRISLILSHILAEINLLKQVNWLRLK